MSSFKDFSNEKLCEIIISSQYLGILEKEAISCMEELAKRRELGDKFNFEDHISEKTKTLPEFKINLKEKMHVGFDLSVLRGIK